MARSLPSQRPFLSARAARKKAAEQRARDTGGEGAEDPIQAAIERAQAKKAAQQAGAGEETAKFPLLRVPGSIKREALWIITANRGLCGGYNANVLRTAIEHLTRQQETETAVDIHAVFNSSVDDPTSCLAGITWWYGIGVSAPINDQVPLLM